MESYYLGFDLGTTTSKGVIIDSEGHTLASAVREHQVSHPLPGYAEQNADGVWYEDFIMVCRRLLKDADISPKDISGVGISGVYPCVLPVDKNGRPLAPAILYGIDTRNVKEMDAMRRDLGNDFSAAVSGNNITAQSIGPKIMWFKNNRPEVFNSSYKFLFATSYLTYRLTGEYVLDHGSAALGGLPYDKNNLCWDKRSLDYIGISDNQMPKLMWGTEIAGVVSREASEATGLPVGAKVIVGTGDHISEVVSLGGMKKGNAVLSYGTSFGLDFCTDLEIEKQGLQTSLTLEKGLYLTGGCMKNGAYLTKWFRDQLGYKEIEEERKTGRDAYEILSEEAEKISAGSDSLIALPYFNGECCPIINPGAKGILFGLTQEHTRAHIYRALLEGVAYGVRHIQEIIEEEGIPIVKALAVGGGTKSRVWTQIVSDVTGIEQIITKDTHGSPRGSALMAAYACGAISSLDDIEKKNEVASFVYPNPVSHKIYEEAYKTYRELYSCTEELMHKL